jgi:hypothetical protein
MTPKMHAGALNKKAPHSGAFCLFNDAIARRSLNVMTTALDADLAVVLYALGAGARVLRDAEHALHAAGDTADHTTHRATDHGADRTECLAAGVKAFLSTARDALRVRRRGHCEQRERCGGKRGLHADVIEAVRCGGHDCHSGTLDVARCFASRLNALPRITRRARWHQLQTWFHGNCAAMVANRQHALALHARGGCFRIHVQSEIVSDA